MNRDQLSHAIRQWASEHRREAEELVAKLVRFPSVNNPPVGSEAEYQQFFADWMKAEGADVEVYALEDVPGLREHAAYMDTRDYTNRPNVIGCFFGGKEEAGKSILFSGHADVVYEGTEAWTHPPFSGAIENGKLFGRGSYDMKGGMAAALMAVKCLQSLRVQISGSVYVESVVDEEHGGANGTLAGRLRGYAADMAVIPEPSNMKLYPAHMGVGIWKATFKGKSGSGFNGEELISALDATLQFGQLLHAFRLHWQERHRPPHWWKDVRLQEVSIMTLLSGDVSRALQEKIPDTGEMNFAVEGYPGISGDEIESELWSFYEKHAAKYPLLSKVKPTIVPLIRYLEGSEMKLDEKGQAFLRLAEQCGERATGKPVDSPQGSPFGCDAFMFNLYSETPALILGPSGGNAHAADEFLDLASYEQLICWYAEMIVDWCGIHHREG